MKVGILFNIRAFWIGFYYSKYNRRLCINFIPFITLFFVLDGGKFPKL